MSKRNKIFDLVYKTENIMWTFNNWLEYICKTERHKVLSQNDELKNKHYDQTCFILGNGPSLKLETRLNELSDKMVFTVNQMYRSDIFDIVCPQYHVMMDPLFFTLNADDPVEKDTLDRMMKLNDRNIKFILPYAYKKSIEEMKFAVSKDYYMYNRMSVHSGYDKEINLTKYTPVIQNVIQAAIYSAIYMGFKRIVLLGVDMTDIMNYYIRRKPTDEVVDSHVYNYSPEERERMKKVHNLYDNTETFALFSNMFRIYKWINEYSEKHGIKILNASRETALDCFSYTILSSELDIIENERSLK